MPVKHRVTLEEYSAFRDLTGDYPGEDITQRLAEKFPADAARIIEIVESAVRELNVPSTRTCLALLQKIGAFKLSREHHRGVTPLVSAILPNAVTALNIQSRRSLLELYGEELRDRLTSTTTLSYNTERAVFLGPKPPYISDLGLFRLMTDYADLHLLAEAIRDSRLAPMLLVKDTTGEYLSMGTRLPGMGDTIVDHVLWLCETLGIGDILDAESLKRAREEFKRTTVPSINIRETFIMAATLLKDRNYTPEKIRAIFPAHHEATEAIKQVFGVGKISVVTISREERDRAALILHNRFRENIARRLVRSAKEWGTPSKG